MTIIKFKAQTIDLRVNREYYIICSKTLFGDYSVTTCWGKPNTKGQSKSYFFETKNDMEKFVERITHKRLNSEKRIGVNYEVV